MPIALIASAVSAIAPQLAKRGLSLLSGIFFKSVKQVVNPRQVLDIPSKVANLVKDKTGIDLNDAADQKLNDDQWEKIKQFELQNQEQLLALHQEADNFAIEQEQILAKDTADARAKSVNRDNIADTFIRRFTYWYAYLLTGLTFFFIFLVLGLSKYIGTDDKAWHLIDTVVGFLMGTTLSAIVQFFYGSSLGSKEKSDHINDIQQQLAGTAGAKPAAPSGK